MKEGTHGRALPKGLEADVKEAASPFVVALILDTELFAYLRSHHRCLLEACLLRDWHAIYGLLGNKKLLLLKCGDLMLVRLGRIELGMAWALPLVRLSRLELEVALPLGHGRILRVRIHWRYRLILWI